MLSETTVYTVILVIQMCLENLFWLRTSEEIHEHF